MKCVYPQNRAGFARGKYCAMATLKFPHFMSTKKSGPSITTCPFFVRKKKPWPSPRERVSCVQVHYTLCWIDTDSFSPPPLYSLMVKSSSKIYVFISPSLWLGRGPKGGRGHIIQQKKQLFPLKNSYLRPKKYASQETVKNCAYNYM